MGKAVLHSAHVGKAAAGIAQGEFFPRIPFEEKQAGVSKHRIIHHRLDACIGVKGFSHFLCWYRIHWHRRRRTFRRRIRPWQWRFPLTAAACQAKEDTQSGSQTSVPLHR